MANFHFKHETDVLSEPQINFVCEVLEKQGFKNSKVTVETLGKVGDNYGSNVKTITAEQDDGTTLKMVAKVAPTSEFLRTAVNIQVVFGNEILMYSKILPKLSQLEIEADVPEEDRLKYPVFYGMLNEEPYEVILLEDLRESNYVMRDRLKALSNEDVRLVLNSFARLHSLSFVLKAKEPATYKEFATNLSDFFVSPQMEANVINSFTVMEDSICSLFDDNDLKNKIKGSLTSIVNEAHKLNRCDTGSKYTVIIHGDSWTNNILFKLNNDGSPKECMPIDYQIAAERCPVSDVLYLIFSSTDYDTRSKYYHEWIDEYHETLEKYLSHHGIKVNYVYSKEKMLADLKRYSKFFLGWTIMIANVLSMGTEDATKFKSAMDSSDNVDDIMENMKTNGVIGDNNTQVLLKSRIQGIINSYYDFGYLS